MKNCLRSILILYLSMHAILAAGTDEEKSSLQSKIEIIETWLEAHRIYKELPGISIAIISDQDLLYANGFGYSDCDLKNPAISTTLYRIASITKTFTCTAIMQLRDRGLLDLDDTVSRHLPWFRINQKFPESPDITIWHLMTHTSGLPREAAFPYWTDHDFPSMDEIKQTLSEQYTIHAAADHYDYSNLGISLLGEIIENVSGQSYSEYIRTQILEPLQMRDTYVKLNQQVEDRLARCYSIKRRDGSRKIIPVADTQGLTAAANMSSNVLDLSKFIAFNLSAYSNVDQNMIKKSTLKEMHRVQWINDYWASARGIGYSIRKIDNRNVVSHSGWIEAFRSHILFCPDNKIGIVVMTNADDATPSYFADNIFRILTQEMKTVSKTMNPAILNQWSNYQGSYTDPWDWQYKIMVIDHRLFLYEYDYPPQDNPLNSMTQLIYFKPNYYQLSTNHGAGQSFIFEMDDNNNVIRIKKGENYIFPLSAY